MRSCRRAATYHGFSGRWLDELAPRGAVAPCLGPVSSRRQALRLGPDALSTVPAWGEITLWRNGF